MALFWEGARAMRDGAETLGGGGVSTCQSQCHIAAQRGPAAAIQIGTLPGRPLVARKTRAGEYLRPKYGRILPQYGSHRMTGAPAIGQQRCATRCAMRGRRRGGKGPSSAITRPSAALRLPSRLPHWRQTAMA
jgi:hypothetical protein